MTPEQNEHLQQVIYKTIRQAMGDELVVFQAATIGPAIEMLLEMQKSVAMLIDGQALIERHLAGSFDDSSEDWRESLEDD